MPLGCMTEKKNCNHRWDSNCHWTAQQSTPCAFDAAQWAGASLLKSVKRRLTGASYQRKKGKPSLYVSMSIFVSATPSPSSHFPLVVVSKKNKVKICEVKSSTVFELLVSEYPKKWRILPYKPTQLQLKIVFQPQWRPRAASVFLRLLLSEMWLANGAKWINVFPLLSPLALLLP